MIEFQTTIDDLNEVITFNYDVITRSRHPHGNDKTETKRIGYIERYDPTDPKSPFTFQPLPPTYEPFAGGPEREREVKRFWSCEEMTHVLYCMNNADALFMKIKAQNQHLINQIEINNKHIQDNKQVVIDEFLKEIA